MRYEGALGALDDEALAGALFILTTSYLVPHPYFPLLSICS